MRVALVRRGYGATGGAERYLRRFASGLAALGHQPVLVTTPDWPEDAWPNGEIIRLKGRSPLAFADNLAQVRTDLPCDHVFSLERVHVCDTYRAGDGVHAAWLQRRALFEPRWKCLFRRLQPKHHSLLTLESDLFRGGAGKVVVNSRMVAKEIHEHFGTPTDRLHLVYNGYDLPAHESSEEPGHGRLATRQRLGIPTDANMALFTGSGWQRKGLIHAVKAMTGLGRKDLHLVVAGSGKMSPAFRHPRVHFPGPVLDVAPLYAAADFFVLPTLYDPFSNACLEAARHGLPVVTTTANGFAELIQAEVNGLVVPPGDSHQLAAALDYWATGFRAREARATCAVHVAHLTVAANTKETLHVVLT